MFSQHSLKSFYHNKHLTTDQNVQKPPSLRNKDNLDEGGNDVNQVGKSSMDEADLFIILEVL